MRVWFVTCALALAGCSAQPEAEAQIPCAEPDRPVSNAEIMAADKKEKEERYSEAFAEALSKFRDNPSEVNLREARGILKYTDCASFPESQKANREALIGLIAYMESKLAEPKMMPEPYLLDKSTKALSCHGIVKQGGLVVCQTTPNARVEVGRSENDTYTQTADKDGVLLVGFDRDEPAAFVRVGEARVDFDIQKRDYDISRIDGLPKNMVSEYTPEELARIRKASALKKVGFASKVEEVGFKNGFIFPVANFTKTTNFGAQRILNGEPKRPHFGVDLAAPKGTPILAPADGIVSLASEEMYFEGSLIMIDHGQGLISYYLHNETVDVEDGQRVTQGQQIGTVGSRGRSTGPHLCWRLKWRGRNLDPELLTEWPSHG